MALPMSYRWLGIVLMWVVAGCVTPEVRTSRQSPALPSADGERDGCRRYYELNLANPNQLVGYGEGPSGDSAVDGARVDLAKQIRTRVSSTSSTSETRSEVQLSGVSVSSVDELLVGMRVLKRCGADARQEAVVGIQKAQWLASLRSRVEAQASVLQAHVGALAAAKDEAQTLRAYWAAKQWLEQKEPAFRSDLDLCNAFEGCHGLPQADGGIGDLRSRVESVSHGMRFEFVAKNAEAKDSESSLVRLLGNEGIAIGDDGGNRQAGAQCDLMRFPRVQGNSTFIVGLECRIRGTVGGREVFERHYEGKGIGSSEQDAIQVARNSLKTKQGS